MIELIPYITILLFISAVAMNFILRVLFRQIKLFRRPIEDTNVRHFRVVLFVISLTIIIMGLIPIGINFITMLVELNGGNTGRPHTVAPISFVYSLGVHLQTLFLSYLLWRIYRLASDDDS